MQMRTSIPLARQTLLWEVTSPILVLIQVSRHTGRTEIQSLITKLHSIYGTRVKAADVKFENAKIPDASMCLHWQWFDSLKICEQQLPRCSIYRLCRWREVTIEVWPPIIVHRRIRIICQHAREGKIGQFLVQSARFNHSWVTHLLISDQA